MNPITLLTLSLTLGLGICSAPKHAAEENVEQQLWSQDREQRDAAARALLARRANMLSPCYQIVQSLAGVERRQETVKVAIELLGRFRDVEAVPLLVQNLTFRVHWPAISPRRALRQFPAVEALIEIGLPSVEPVVIKAEESDDELVLTLAYFVVHRVLGARLGVAYLKDRAAQQPDTTKRGRLERLQNALETQKPPAPLPFHQQ